MLANDQSKPERRDWRDGHRLKLNIAVAYSFATFPRGDQKEAPSRCGIVLDISERGLCFKAKDHFFVQRTVSLFFNLPDQSSQVQILGKVAWAGTDSDGLTRAGIKFVGNLPPNWRKMVLHDASSTRPD
jgi:hypothetical protein